jgi:diguanylate cyclase (GGDEF)-like protein/PAS domain S-box-containing protein
MSRKSEKSTVPTKAHGKRNGSIQHDFDVKYRLLVENSPDVIMILDRNGTILFINHTLPEYTVEGVLGTCVAAYLSPRDATRYLHLLTEMFDSGEPRALEMDAVGPTHWLTRIFPIKQRGRVDSALVIATDITERKRTEEALRRSEEEYRKIVTNIHEIVYMAEIGGDPSSGKLSFVNTRTEDIIGYRPEDFLENPGLWFRLVHPEDKTNYIDSTRKIMATRAAGIREYRLKHKETGEYRYVEDKIVPQVGETGEVVGYFGVARDITERKRSDEALRESGQLNQQIICNAREGIIVYDRDLRYVVWNPYMEELTGLKAEKVLGKRPRNLLAIYQDEHGKLVMDKQTVEGIEQSVSRAMTGESFSYLEISFVIKLTGTTGWTSVRYGPLRNALGEIVGVLATVRDVTERREAEEALRSSEGRNRALLNAMPDMMFRVNREGLLLEFIPSKDAEPALSPGEFLEKDIKSLLPADVTQQALYHIRQALDSGDKQVFEFPMLFKGQPHGYEARIVKSGREEVLAIVRDITDRQAQAAALEYQALHDTLTDLPNRTLVLDRLRQAILAAERENQPLALLLMDLDRFKEVNDALGHHHGDLLLRLVGPRVLSVLRESDTIARLGGDEFAILLPATDMNGATVAAQKILDALNRSFVVEGFFLDIGASIGIALFPEHGEDVDMLMRRADVAMYQAKQSGSGYAVYILEHDRHSPSRLTLMGELRHAVERKELLLHYQPKIDLKTGGTIGVEALVRWHHPQQGLIYPDQFITLAEHVGVIKPLTLWVLTEATRQGFAWRRAGLEITVAVNLSVRNLHDLHLPDWIAGMLATSQLPPEGLNLEITESAIMADPARAMEILTRLRGMGIRLSIDDFGAGYSSLSYLKKLPVTEVKVDKSFIIGMSGNVDDAVIVRSTIDLAHNLGLKVAAEGVESQAVLDRLIAMGCDQAQGYFISRPIPAPELARWLSDSPWGMKRSK